MQAPAAESMRPLWKVLSVMSSIIFVDGICWENFLPL